MAPVTPRLADSQRTAQGSLLTLFLRDLAALWRALIGSGNPAQALESWIQQVADLINGYGAASATLAGDWYEDLREAAGATSRFDLPAAPEPSYEQVEESLRWATHDLWGENPNPGTVKLLVDGVAGKLVLDEGRDQVNEAVAADPQATGWARVPRPDCCHFCAMLASRGAVYKTEAAATTVLEETLKRYGKSYHDHCHCVVTPVFTGQTYKPDAQIKTWQKLWHDSTQGLSGDDARIAFRQAFEGREPTQRAHNRAQRKARKAAEVGTSGRTPSEIRAEIAALERTSADLAATGRNPDALAYQRERIASLRRLLGD